MIAASEPQEFIPSGRQQILRHPGLPKGKFTNDHSSVDDALILNRLKYVSITSSPNSSSNNKESESEWWTIRESRDFQHTNSSSSRTEEIIIKHSDGMSNRNECYNSDDCSWSWKTIDPGVGLMNISKQHGFSDESKYYHSSGGTGAIDSRMEKLVCKKVELGSMEEELYVKGATAIWSKGLNRRITLCSYTMENPILHALWCTFYLERPSMNGVAVTTKGKPLPCICLIDACVMRVFCINNEDFITSLQFDVESVWNTEFGIILETNDSNLVSLSHPLDEFCPIAIKQHSSTTVHFFNHSSFKVIFTCSDPSICFGYDSSLALHVLYRIRKIQEDELLQVSVSSNQIKLCTNTISSTTTSSSVKYKHNLSLWSSGAASATGIPLATGSPYNSSTSHSRSYSSPMANISRQSPSISPFVTGSAWVNHTTYHEETNTTTNGADVTQQIEPKPTNPELCFEHIWSEKPSNNNNKNNFALSSSASKAFLSCDLVGHNYLCYLIPTRSQLVLLRIDLSNDNNLIFGSSYVIHAKDAIQICTLNMIAILESNGHIMLYSGPNVIGKLHVGGVSAEFTASPNVNPSCLKSPFPRRSSLLPNCTTPSASIPKFDDYLISPVHPAKSSFVKSSHQLLHSTLLTEAPRNTSCGINITALRDSVCDRIILQYSDNSYYRIVLPALASGMLVESCLNALRQSLHRDIAMTVFSKWYATRNAPGPLEFTAEQEWNIFSSFLYGLLGYDIEKLKLKEEQMKESCVEIKRQRPSSKGTNEDWQQLLQSDFHKHMSFGLTNLLNFKKNPIATEVSIESDYYRINPHSILFPYFRLVLFTLHLLYEELKLNTLRFNELPLLAQFLHQLSSDLRLNHYVCQYWKDFPDICSLKIKAPHSQMSENDFIKIHHLSIFSTEEPVNIMQQIYHLLNGVETISPYPFMKHVNPTSKNILQICGLIVAGRFDKQDVDLDSLIKVFAPPGSSSVETAKEFDYSKLSYRKWSWAEKVVVFMTEKSIFRRHFDTIPEAINLLIHEALWQCRENPPTDWISDSYYLIQRPDLAVQAQQNSHTNHNQNFDKENKTTTTTNNQTQLRDILPTIKQYDPEREDGMEDIESTLLKLRFPDDRRVAEVRRLLQSSEPVQIDVEQRSDVSDHDFIEEQEKHLYAICTRTMALPIGRGMFTMRTATPVVTEPLPVPKLCLTGRCPPLGASVELTHIDTPPNMNFWPLFHNGVAAGLRISPDASDIDSTWIVFNKPKSTTDSPMEHAGFLMALGLNGHIKNLAVMNMYKYLVKFQEMTSLGLLLGLSASKRATMDTATTKMLSIHIEALLPPTSMELDIPHNIQVAALLGIGLVYQGSAHRHMTEVLLSEIGRPPGPEMENSVDRESYSLAAGLALGLVTLKQGGKPSEFSDLGVPDMLHYYMTGGNKRPLTGSQKDKYKVTSFQIREGSTVNLDVTAPGATLALGLMYLASGNRAIANWMRPPDTQYLLDFVRPDFLMLRIISRALILWDDIETTIDWVDKQVPEAIRPFCLEKPDTDTEMDIDYEAMNQAYCNIVAGACFALGLKYAGSADENAFQTLYHYCRMFTSMTGKSIAELAGKPTIETCLNLILLSLAMIMAGTGRIEVLRLCRHLRKRVGVANSTVVTYGSHLTTHMALGLLFLGGGRYTLSNSAESVAAMLCAFFPKFPTHSNDNRYHLQAFRHLYVLAVEARLLIPRDVLTGRMCYTNLSMVRLNGSSFTMRAPCLLPDLSSLARVSVQDDRYWTVVFERGRNWEQLHLLLESSGHVEVKQRAGCLSYLEDRQGSRSLLARTLTQSNTVPWTPLPSAINSFSSEPTVKYFTDYFLSAATSPSPSDLYNIEEQTLRQTLTMAMYECVTKDKLAILPIWISFIKAIDSLKTAAPRSYLIWQLKLLLLQVLSPQSTNHKSLISPEIALSMKQKTTDILDKWDLQLSSTLKSFIIHGEIVDLSHINQFQLASYITYYDIPYKINLQDNRHYLEIFHQLKSRNIPTESVDRIISILLSSS